MHQKNVNIPSGLFLTLCILHRYTTPDAATTLSAMPIPTTNTPANNHTARDGIAIGVGATGVLFALIAGGVIWFFVRKESRAHQDIELEPVHFHDLIDPRMESTRRWLAQIIPPDSQPIQSHYIHSTDSQESSSTELHPLPTFGLNFVKPQAIDDFDLSSPRLTLSQPSYTSVNT